MLLFLGTLDVHRRDWRALLRRMRLLRLGNKRQKTRVLRFLLFRLSCGYLLECMVSINILDVPNT